MTIYFCSLHLDGDELAHLSHWNFFLLRFDRNALQRSYANEGARREGDDWNYWNQKGGWRVAYTSIVLEKWKISKNWNIVRLVNMLPKYVSYT